MKISEICEALKNNNVDCYNCYHYNYYYNTRALYKFRKEPFNTGCVRFLLTHKPYLYEDDLRGCSECIITIRPKLFNYYKLFI